MKFIEIVAFSLKKINLKMSSAKWHLFLCSLSELSWPIVSRILYAKVPCAMYMCCKVSIEINASLPNRDLNLWWTCNIPPEKGDRFEEVRWKRMKKLPSNLQYKPPWIQRRKCFLSRRAAVFAHSIGARSKVENEDVVRRCSNFIWVINKFIAY